MRMRLVAIALATSEFLKVLETADSYFADGNVLKLHRARMAPLAVFEAAKGEEKSSYR